LLAIPIEYKILEYKAKEKGSLGEYENGPLENKFCNNKKKEKGKEKMSGKYEDDKDK
jgi:hypothetical protein